MWREEMENKGWEQIILAGVRELSGHKESMPQSVLPTIAGDQVMEARSRSQQ